MEMAWVLIAHEQVVRDVIEEEEDDDAIEDEEEHPWESQQEVQFDPVLPRYH